MKAVIIGVVLGVIAAAAWYFLLRPGQVPFPEAQQEQESGLGKDLNTNPGSAVPEANPFQQTNPFGGYRNPFGE